jgi:hypothetical protein
MPIQSNMRFASLLLSLLVWFPLSSLGANGPQKISVPNDLNQYLVKENGRLVAVPTAAPEVTGSAVVVVEEPQQLSLIEEYRKVRAAYGGKYPYLVVRSRESYIVISQDDDVLVVGTPDPRRVIVASDTWLRVDRREKGGLIGRKMAPVPVDVTYVQGRLEVGLVLPPGVPDDLLSKRDLHGPSSSVEATYEVNRKRVIRLGGQTTYRDIRDAAGIRYEVYRVILK